MGTKMKLHTTGWAMMTFPGYPFPSEPDDINCQEMREPWHESVAFIQQAVNEYGKRSPSSGKQWAAMTRISHMPISVFLDQFAATDHSEILKA